MNLPPPSFAPQRHSSWNLLRNPIFRRYCQSRLRLRGLSITLLITILVAGFIAGMSHAIAVQENERVEDLARGAFIVTLVVQGLILFMLGTAQVAGGMTAERDEGVIDYQRLVPMSPLAKVVGYLFGLPVREYVMFFTTLPFSAWLAWRGNIAPETWLPLYTVFFTSTLLYHFTGLLTGTVARNRRWAFLASIGLVFALYTVIPYLSKFGLVFFKYLTIRPVFEELLPGMLPRDAAAVVEAGQRLVPTVKFFGLDFSEMVFTVFSQGGLVITFTMMLCRKWRRHESHLLGKVWATGFFIWIQMLLLGNALPLIDPGTLFPSREFTRYARMLLTWSPKPEEALAMSALYGLATMMLLFILGGIITPTPESQIRGWRRARKQGDRSLPFLSDASTAFGSVVVMALAGAAGWYLFTRGLVESRWFDGHVLPLSVFGYFAAILLASGLGFQVLLETKGGRAVGLAAIFVGVVPIMIGALLSAMGGRLVPIAMWFIGISPLSMPAFAAGSLLPMVELPEQVIRAVPRAFQFWLFVSVIGTVWLVVRLWETRKAMAADVLSAPVEPAPPMGS